MLQSLPFSIADLRHRDRAHARHGADFLLELLEQRRRAIARVAAQRRVEGERRAGCRPGSRDRPRSGCRGCARTARHRRAAASTSRPARQRARGGCGPAGRRPRRCRRPPSAWRSPASAPPASAGARPNTSAVNSARPSVKSEHAAVRRGRQSSALAGSPGSAPSSNAPVHDASTRPSAAPAEREQQALDQLLPDDARVARRRAQAAARSPCGATPCAPASGSRRWRTR